MISLHAAGAFRKLLAGAGILLFLAVAAGAQTLLHHWKLDGDATDAVGGADGTELGGLDYVAGQFGQAVSLDGVDDYIATSAGSIVPATDYTLMAWVRWDGEGANGSRGYIAGAQGGGTAGEVFTMSRAADGTDRKLFLNLLNNGGQGNSITESADGTISTGVWQHVAYTVDSTNGTTIFLNGVAVGSNAVRTTHDPSSTLFHIGNNPDTGAPNLFDGLIDDVAIFGGVLTGAQLDQTRTSGVGSFGPSGLLHHWKFDESSGQVAMDSAGGSDGTLGATPGVEASDPAVNQPGMFGTAYAFNEAEVDRVTIANFGGLGGLSTGSVTGWFKTSIVSPGLRGVLFRYGDATATDRLILEMQTDGRLRVVLRDSAINTIDLTSAVSFDDGNWHHFAITQDGVAATLHVDGTALAGAALSTSITSGDWFPVLSDTADSMSIGWEVRQPGNVNIPFGGLIDDVAVFDRALDATEIANVISSGADSFNSDMLPPTVSGFSPVPGASGVYPGADLVASFSEDVVWKSGGAITIRNLDDGSGASDVVITLPDARVSVSGSDLVIDPAVNLAFGTHFAVRISADAIEDDAAAPNAFAGIADDTTWFFSTVAQDLTAPAITVRSPADDAVEVARSTNIVATFDEDILAGSGDIVIKDLEDGSTTRTISVTDAAQVSIDGNVLTVDPLGPLAADREYAVQMAAGAVMNFSDVGFAGIPASDDTTWNFRTRSMSPNVIFLLGDDQAWYDYSFMRRPSVEQAAINMNASIYQVAETPAIDRLADEGLTFTHGYTTPICRPSLASIITGAFPHQTLVTGNDLTGRPPDQEVEARMQVLHPLPRTLATELGYTSFQTGKWWEGDFANGGFTHGDTVNSTAGGTAPTQWSGGRPGYVTARHGDWGLMAGRVDYVNDVAAPANPIPYANTVETATDFIDAQVTAGQPFFLWYAPFLPHTPHDPPTGLTSKYDALINEPNESGDYFAKYYANIERFDGGVGAILDHLDAQGIADNTIVVLICDNGWINKPNASAYDVRSKQTPYEGGIRTPIIVRWPDRIKSGGAIEPQMFATPVSLVDLVPTVHDALGLATYPEMTGISLLDLAAVAARDTIFSEDSTHDIQDFNDPSQSLESRVAIRDGWKLILFTNGNTALYHLYDTATGMPVDPHETNDLSGGHPARVSELTAAIVSWYAVDANDFDSWISDPGFAIVGGAQGFALDGDGDGLANGLEAWFGTHPGVFNAGLVHVSTSGPTSTFAHPRSPNPPSDLTGFYEWSPNLVDWYEGDGVAGPAGGPTVTITASASGSSTSVLATANGSLGQLFLRTGVVQD